MSEERPIQRGDIVSFDTQWGGLARAEVIDASNPKQVRLCRLRTPHGLIGDRFTKPLSLLQIVTPAERRLDQGD